MVFKIFFRNKIANRWYHGYGDQSWSHFLSKYIGTQSFINKILFMSSSELHHIIHESVCFMYVEKTNYFITFCHPNNLGNIIQ